MKSTFVSYDDLKVVSLEISTFCNARCPMCSRHVSHPHEGKHLIDTSKRYRGEEVFLDKKILLKVFDEDFLNNIDEVIFNGKLGEAILHPDFLEIIKSIKSVPNSPSVRIYTNGSLKDRVFWKCLATTLDKDDRVVFSIDGLESTNAYYRQGTDWCHITRSFTSFIDHGGQADWEYIVFRHNEHQVEKAREYARKVGFVDFILRKTNRFKGKDDFNFIDSKGKYATLSLPKSSYFVHDFHDSYLNNKKSEYIIDCHFKKHKKIFISHTGKVWPCSFISEYYPKIDSEVSIVKQFGEDFNDLRKHTVSEILNHSFFKSKLSLSWLDSEKTYKECWKKCTRFNSNVTEIS